MLAAQQVRDLNDYSALHTLQQQLELLQSKQAQLLMEQSDLMKQQPHSSARFSNCSLNLLQILALSTLTNIPLPFLCNRNIFMYLHNHNMVLNLGIDFLLYTSRMTKNGETTCFLIQKIFDITVQLRASVRIMTYIPMYVSISLFLFSPGPVHYDS